jgi:RNA-binding protein NOB1
LKRASLDDESQETGSVEGEAGLKTSEPDADGDLTEEATDHEGLEHLDNKVDDSPQVRRLPSETKLPPQSDIAAPAPLYDDPSDDDDGEGEWITPSNVALHKCQALDLLPNASGKGKRKSNEVISVGCMTADFAMQNVLLHMGLNLVSVGGDRIERVKRWVLRCHACFK